MATFRIHEDQENDTLRHKKESAEIFSTAPQRRALGDLGHIACNQNRNVKLPGLTNGPVKVQEEAKTLQQINKDKNIVPPVAQFRAFSVYEDNPSQAELKKREPTFKPFGLKDLNIKEKITNENAKANLVQNAVLPERPKDAPTNKRSPLQEKRDVPPVPPDSPLSVSHDSSVMSIARNDNSAFNDEDVEDDEAVTAQTDREMFFHVVQYRQDIYEYMREIEVKHRPNPRYMRKQPDISHSMRTILVDWLAEVCEEYHQQTETLHLAVSYVDRFLSFMSVLRGKLQLVGTAATFIAAKYEEVHPPEVGDFVYITDDTYTKREVLRMEHLILKVLSFDLSTPTPLAFLSHYCIANGLSKKIFHLASYIAELSLLEAEPYLQFSASLIAASALATARHCLLCRHCDEDTDTEYMFEVRMECALVSWPPALARSSGYEMAALETCARHLARSHAHAALQPHRAIPDKYAQNKFDGVSTIVPKAMYLVPKYQSPVSGNKGELRQDGRPGS